ncbi:helix-turn-helix domain-containing protein [Pseudomaricurvus alkylphenolicus]|jgi:AraC family transcriptional regulator|nr:GyrI-like domain-containing protein [Pseudomaricurvus alkylphenolicus]NIB40726.1 helix-turn-helix domain-containing protein [Pseudomaricurvus alkylphenolicus]
MSQAQQDSRINDVLHEIHRDISADCSARRLSAVALYSEQHFHRVFHRVVGETLAQYVRRVRLEHSANQLMFDRESTVLEIATKCGFQSLSSYTHAFKAHFGVTPGQWRAEEVEQEAPPFLMDAEIAMGYRRIENQSIPEPQLVNTPDQPVAYIRHRGYNRSIRTSWQLLRAWAESEGRPFDGQFGLHHSNPAWVPLEDCRYVACLAIDRPIHRRGKINSMVIPGGLRAAFELRGIYGELLPWLSRILEQWLPASGLKLETVPAYVHYRRNQFLDKEGRFDLTLYLPVSLL